MRPFVLRSSSASAIFALSALASALWIAICAAAPEFLWRGLRLAADHLTQADLLSVLLIGLVLAFFIDPLMERVHSLLRRGEHRPGGEDRPRSALFAVATSFAFAIASVCLHDVMIAFLHGPGAEPAAANPRLSVGIALTAAWALVPFVITLAWLSTRCRWAAIPIGIIALLSPVIAGWLFAWTLRDVITTVIPCALILGLGYRSMMAEPGHRSFTRHARMVATVAIAWLAFALVLDAVFTFLHMQQTRLYSWVEYWEDARFYLGWTLGLLLAPFPADAPGAARG